MSAEGTFFHLHEEDPVEAYENFKFGMWCFLATEVLMFGGLFAALFIFKFKAPEVFREGSNALNWQLGAVNTAILLASSFTMALAVDAAQRGKQGRLKLNLLLTFLGGCGFLVVKYIEYKSKYSHGIWPGENLDLFFSVYFMATGLHLIHVLIGMFFIALVWVRAVMGRYNENNFGGVEIGGLYWHLVDLIWIFLFPLLYLLHF